MRGLPTLLALGLAALVVPGAVAYAQARVLPEKSEIRFVVKQENVPIEGKFRKFTAEVTFDPNRPEAGRAVVDIDPGSIDLNSGEAEAEIRDKLWFNIAVFPQARFTMTSMKALEGGRFEARGTLTIKGVTRELAAPFTLRQQGGESIAEGTVVLKRLEFKVGEGEWADPATVANEVQVRFRLTMTGVPQAK